MYKNVYQIRLSTATSISDEIAVVVRIDKEDIKDSPIYAYKDI